jgi:hypothetical protein
MAYATTTRGSLKVGDRFTPVDCPMYVREQGEFSWGRAHDTDLVVLIPDGHEPWQQYEVLDIAMRRFGRPIAKRKVANNTYLVRIAGAIAVQYHDTPVLMFWPNGDVRFASGGFGTRTTKERMHRFLPEGWMVWTSDLPNDPRRWELVGPDTSTLLCEGTTVNLRTGLLVDVGCEDAPMHAHAKYDHPDPEWVLKTRPGMFR